MKAKRDLVFADVECFIDYFLIGFKRFRDGKVISFQKYDGCDLKRAGIEQILRDYTIVTFNGNNYDVPMINLAMKGASCEELKRASDNIIQDNLRGWQFSDLYNVRTPRYVDHIDLFEIAKGKVSLKLYGGRMHSRWLQDLPLEHDASVTGQLRQIIVDYNVNDLDTTEDHYKALIKEIELRITMSEQYGIDLRSKSDAQIAEAVIKSQIEQITGNKVVKPKNMNHKPFKYEPPKFLSFRTEYMRNVFDVICNTDFKLVKGKVLIPKAIADLDVQIGESSYTFGIGGLHSCEKSAAHFTDADNILIDRDVTSYYPFIILMLSLFPKHLGEVFLSVYRAIVNRRIAAKRAGDKVMAEVLKIVINGSFGKFGDKFSALFSPKLLIQTTITGQLSLLMLIEHLECAGIPVVSANTDGVVIKCPRHKIDIMNTIISMWEFDTDFNTEETRYMALYSRDVNNYIALKQKYDKENKVWIEEFEEAKLKGAFGKTSLDKNPTSEISSIAVVDYLTKSIPLIDTIESCSDIRKFMNVRQVNGGAVAYKTDVLPRVATKTFKLKVLAENGITHFNMRTPKAEVDWAYGELQEESIQEECKYLGKVVRWYYSTEDSPPLRYKINLKKVAASDNAKPMMVLKEGIPEDLNYYRYLNIAEEMLMDIGARKRPPKKVVKLSKRQLQKLIEEFDTEDEEL